MNWKIINTTKYQEYIDKYQMNPLLAKVLAYKETPHDQVQDIFNDRIVYHDFSLFLESEMVLDRIQEAIENDEKICIYGDYDCDGILATTILVEAFRKLGKQVGYHIPDRKSDGYGLNVHRVEQMAQKGYSLIITVDNGVKAYDAIEKANELGVDVIITDHHNFEEDLPDACAIIHTKLSPDYPFKEISGGFIAYKLASALLEKHDKYLYSLAACTTISDMMPLVDENRSLVKRALKFMQEEKFPALELLLGENQTYSAQSIGFIIAPKINSFGRLPEVVNPTHLVKFFLSDTDPKYLHTIATKAVEINKQRQSLTNKQYKEILGVVTPNERFLYCSSLDIHEGLIGLVAGKYTHQFHRPSFVLHYDSDSDMYKGSARGTNEIPLLDIFEHIKPHLAGYGGHALAGGFSVTKENVDVVKQEIDAYMDTNFKEIPEPSISVLQIDDKDISKDNIKSLDVLEPLGTGNSEVIFYLEQVSIEKVYQLSQGKHLKFDVRIGDIPMQCLYFHKGELYEQYQNVETVQMIGKLNINRYLNRESINLIIEDMK